MTIKKIQKQIDLFKELITKSRAIIIKGHFVDISNLDTKANYLFNQIKGQHGNLSNAEMNVIIASVENLLSDFDTLAKALDNQYSGLSAETEAWPNTAIAAYQN
jgi:hypothetical protein